MAIVLDIQQRTPEWKAMRRKGIGASDVPAIMGVSPWKTDHDLWLEKTGQVDDDHDNQRMKRGRDLEAEAMEAYELEHGLAPPAFIIHSYFPWAFASLDGLNVNLSIPVEAKCPGEKDHAIALSGHVPNHYYPQVQHQIWVMDSAYAHYWSYDGREGKLVVVERDEDYITRMVEAEMAFWYCVVNNIEPDGGERKDPAWEVAAAAYRLAKLSADEAAADAEMARQTLIGLLGDASQAKGCGVTVTRFPKKGSVDYKAAGVWLADVLGEPVDWERWRKPETTEVRISLEKQA